MISLFTIYQGMSTLSFKNLFLANIILFERILRQSFFYILINTLIASLLNLPFPALLYQQVVFLKIFHALTVSVYQMF